MSRFMTMQAIRWGATASGLVVACTLNAATLGTLRAAERTGDQQPAGVEVGLFEAMADGRLQVKFIPKDDRQARLIMKNTSDQPLNVRLPDAFAGVPVLAQFGGGGGGLNVGGGGGGNQGVGGGGGGFGGGGNQFNIAPEKVAEARLTTVCLEHGKRTPKPNVPYEIRPIETFTSNAAVHELLALLGTGKVNQRAAQAAAWHLNNDLSWEELAAKEIKHIGRPGEPYFTAAELQAAMALSQEAERRATEAQKDKPAASARNVPSAQ